MASGIEGHSAESLSPSNAQPQDMGFSESPDPYQSATISEITSRKPSPSRTVLKSPPKNGVPPKRLSITTKRTTLATASASSKSNPPPTWGAPGTGLSKPPTRPSISSAVRRPATSVTAATAASTGHKKRSSIASNEINSVKRGDISGAEENINPTSSKPEARRDVYGKGDLKNAMQNSHADRPNLATKAEQSAASGRMSNTSPMKSVLRSTTNSSRPSSMHTTPRGIRPTASSAAGVTKAETTKKRLSTILASPAPANPETTTSEPSIAPAAAKAIRPVLHSRKSTMSVTVEQRLREMDLVHEMLRVAIAENVDDDDEVKEEYGRKVDESLASLRIRLEEARRNQGIDPQESEIGRVSSEQSIGVTTDQATSGDSKLLEALQTLELDLAAEKKNSAVATSMSDELQLEVSRLRTVLSEQRQRLADTERRLDEHADVLEEKENTIAGKERDIVDLQRAIQELHANQACQLEDVERVSLNRRNDLEHELSRFRDNLSQLELSHQSVISSHEREVEGKNEEIKGLAQVIEGFQAQMQDIHEQKERAVDETKLELIEEHEKVVSHLRRKHRDETAELALSHEQKLQALQAEHDNALRSANELLQTSELRNESLEYEISNGKKIIEDLEQQMTPLKYAVAVLNDELKEALDGTELFRGQLRYLEDEAEDRMKRYEAESLEYANGKKIIEDLELQVTALKYAEAVLKDDFKSASDEITVLRGTLRTLETDAEDKEKEYATAVRKIEEELAGSTKTLEEGSTERETTLKRHAEETNSLTSLHNVDLKSLESESRDALLELQKRTMDLENLQTTHAIETRDKLDQVERTHQEEIRALVESQDQKCNSLCQELNLANEQLQQYKDSQDGLAQAERYEELAEQAESLKSELAKSQVEFSQANTEIARLATEVEEARKTLQDTTESDQLRYEMFELTRQHAAEISRVQEAVALENEKRAKERKQGAEVRDRLVSETEKLTNDLSATKSEADKYRQDLLVAKTEIQEEVRKNGANCQAMEVYKAGHRKVVDDLKVARAEIEKLTNAMPQGQREGSSNINQELEALQMAADAERNTNTKLRDQIREATVAAERQATRLREVECALKVTTAELVEVQTVRPTGSEYSASPAPKSGLRSSRWAIPDISYQINSEGGEEDENLGSTIYGNMAGMQEQIRQMEDINKDLLEDEKRIMKRLSLVSLPTSPSSGSNSVPSTSDIREAIEGVL